MVVGFFSLLSSLTGILVEAAIGSKLGLSRSSDTFYVAFTVPYIITNLIAATGQFSLVPFFATLEARHSREELWRGFSYAVNVIFLGLGVVAVVGAAVAPLLMWLIAPGITKPQIERAAQLAEPLFFIIISAGIAEVFRSFLLSQQQFALPSAATFFRNVAVIFFTLVTFNRYGEYSIVLGYLAGVFLQAAILGAKIITAFPVRYSLVLAGSGEAFRNLRGASAAQVLAAGEWQVVVIVERIIASFLPPGTLTALNYGFKILGTLSELLAGSVGTASLASISRAVVLAGQDAARRTFQSTLELSLVLVSPATVFCLLLDHNIIRLVFQRGNFTPMAGLTMSLVFFYYSLSLPLFSGIRVLTFYLFARQEASVFLRLAVLLYSSNIALDILYVGVLRMGAKGIPLGLFTSLIVACGVAYRQNLGGLHQVLDRSLGLFTAKNLLGSALAALVVWALHSWLRIPQTGFQNFLYLVVLCGAGSLVFLGTLVASQAIPASQLSMVWQRARGL